MGPSAAVQPSLAFLRSCLTSLEVPRPTKTVMLHRQPQPLIPTLNYPISPITDLAPPSSLFTSLPVCHVLPSIMVSNKTQDSILLRLHHWPTSPLGFSSLLPGLMSPLLLLGDTSLPFTLAPGSHLQTWALNSDGKKWGREGVWPPEANIIMLNNLGVNQTHIIWSVSLRSVRDTR